MEIRKRPSLAMYHYLIHPEFGWMFARIQTWFPFAINIYVNGREWLARQMDREKLQYVRQVGITAFPGLKISDAHSNCRMSN